MVRIRELNDAGIEKFKYYLAAMRETGESETSLPGRFLMKPIRV